MLAGAQFLAVPPPCACTADALFTGAFTECLEGRPSEMQPSPPGSRDDTIARTWLNGSGEQSRADAPGPPPLLQWAAS
jgi:hypothetical protein